MLTTYTLRTYNDPGERMQFVNGTGAPDLYGLDFYPNNFNCTPGPLWNPVPTNFHEYHLETAPERPFFLPEFQGQLIARGFFLENHC